MKQNVPNPFRGETIIGFTLPEAGEAQISIMDASGKLVYNVKGQFVQGYNEVKILKNELPGTGYSFRLDSDAGSSVRKMVYLNNI
ncbi:MAG: T9SS type A sorting domain-containing protein [Saprospiraceae bacterium]